MPSKSVSEIFLTHKRLHFTEIMYRRMLYWKWCAHSAYNVHIRSMLFTSLSLKAQTLSVITSL